MNKHYSVAVDRWVYDDPEIEAWVEEVREYAHAKKTGQPAPRVERQPRIPVVSRDAINENLYGHTEYARSYAFSQPNNPDNWNTNTTANASDLTEQSLLEDMLLVSEHRSSPTATQVRMQQSQAALRLAQNHRASQAMQAELENAYWQQQRSYWQQYRMISIHNDERLVIADPLGT